MFDPEIIHNTVKKINKQSIELDELQTELKSKCRKIKYDKKFPPKDVIEKLNDIDMEET